MCCNFLLFSCAGVSWTPCSFDVNKVNTTCYRNAIISAFWGMAISTFHLCSLMYEVKINCHRNYIFKSFHSRACFMCIFMHNMSMIKKWKQNYGAFQGKLIHCGLVMPYGDIDMGQHWLRQWLVASWHQAITQTIVDFSSKVFCGIHLSVRVKIACGKISYITYHKDPLMWADQYDAFHVCK